MLQKNLLALMLFLLVAQLGLIGFAYIQFATRSPGQFFQQMPNGENVAIIDLDRPNVSINALLSWVTLAATATFTFDFVNYKDQLNALRNYFTVDGYDNFINSLTAANTINTINEKNLVLSAVAVGPAIVISEEEQGSMHNWRIQVPILIRYQSASVNETRQQIVEVLVTQVPTKDAPKGIGIAQYIARENTTETKG